MESLSEQIIAEVYLQLLALPLLPNDEITRRLLMCTATYSGAEELRSHMPLTDAQRSYVNLLIEKTRDKVDPNNIPEHLYPAVMTRRLGFDPSALEGDE